MGSFYGNIKNSNKSQFTFDKVYPNRRQADLYAEHDSVFTGRYILVDYDYYDGVDGGWDNYDTIRGKDDNIKGVGRLAKEKRSSDEKFQSLVTAFNNNDAYTVGEATKRLQLLQETLATCKTKIGNSSVDATDTEPAVEAKGLLAEKEDLEDKISNAPVIADTTVWENRLTEVNAELEYYETLRDKTLLKIGDEKDTNVNTAYGDLWRAKLCAEYMDCFDRRNVYIYGGHLHDIGVITYDEDKNTTPYLTPGFTKYSSNHIPERDKSYFYKETDENNNDIWYVDNNYESVIAHWGVDREYYYFHWGKNTVFTIDYKARIVDQEIVGENGEKHTSTLMVYDVEDGSNYVLTYANLVWDNESRVHMEYELESIGSETEKYMYVFNYSTWEKYNKDPESYNYYLCTAYDGSVETWEHVVDPSYSDNYNIDQNYCETHIGRGYDCTVWQKIYSNGKLSYAMLAELNSIVPTFAISADAPTETAMAPHFDDRSTNVFYHLHTQPSWGMRIKKADESISESDGLRYMSDADDKSAIYYNKKGFDPRIITISDKYGVGDNNLNGVSEDRWGWKPGQPDVIDVLSTGKSGTLYNQYVKDENGNIMLNNAGYPMHDLASEMIEQPDTKEIVAMLPSFGDTVAEMWNLTYGDEKANKEYNRRFSDSYADQGRHRNMTVDWDDNHTGLRLVTRERDGYHFEKDQVQTIAGAINTTHDFIGKIIRNYPVYYEVPKYRKLKDKDAFDINITYYHFIEDDDGKRYERTGLLTQEEFDANKSNLYIEEDIPIDKLSDNRIYYKKPTYEEYIFDDGDEFVPNMHYFAWDPVEYKFSDILTFNYSYKVDERSTDPMRVERLRLCDITKKEQRNQARDLYGKLYIVKDEGKFLRKYKYYEYYNDDNPVFKDDNPVFKKENKKFKPVDADGKATFIQGDETLPNFDINDNRYFVIDKNDNPMIDYNDSNKYYFSESPDYLYETRGYFEEDKEYYTISEVPGSHAALFNQYNVDDNYYWTDKEQDPNADLYVKSEDKSPSKKKQYYYYDDFEDPELIEDAFIYAPQVYFYVKLDDLVTKILPKELEELGLPPLVEGKDYFIDQDGTYTLSEDLENQYIPLTSTMKYESAIKYLHSEFDSTLNADKIARDKNPTMTQNCVYYYPHLTGAVNADGIPDDNSIDYFIRVPKMVNFDAEHFYQKVYVDANDTTKYYTNEDKLENYYEGFAKIKTNPINLRNKVGKEDDPFPYVYQKPYHYYFICKERYLTGSRDLVKPNMHRVIDFYEPCKWYYYKEGVGYILEESDHANPEINKKYEKIVDAWYSAGNTSPDNIPASKFFESGCYCKIIPEDQGNVFIPDTYYIKNTDGTYELAHKYEEGQTYYTRSEWYVAKDDNEIYQKGMKWELDFIPKGVTLSIRYPHYELIELPGFARTANTLNGIILKSHELIGDGEDQLSENNDYKNFEPDNIQGVLNTYENHFETHVKTHHESDIGDLTIIDNYGRIAAAAFKSKQDVSYTNVGKPGSNPASETEQSYLSYDKDDGISNQTLDHQIFNLTHVAAHKKADTTTTADKNTDGANGNGLNAAHGNTISLYTPIVDSMGHIVGKNTETVTLPYGFKTITTNGRSTDNDTTYGNKTALAAQASLVADNTQDTLAIDSGDSWIKLTTDAANDKIIISHDVKKTSTSTSTATLSTETDSTTTFDVFTYTFDDRNHFKNVDTKTITMPNSYGKIIGDNKSDGKNVVSEATATHDTFAIIGDNWLTSTISKDKVTLTHDNANSVAERKVANVTPAFGSTFTIEDWRFDSKGHMYGGAETHTVKIPQGSYTNTPATANATGIITSIGFTPTTGAITSTSNYLGAIKLGSYTKPTTIKTVANASITALNFDTNTTLSSAINALDSRIMAEEKARADAIDDLDVAGASNISSSKTILSWNENNGKVNITTQDISIASSQINDKTDSYSATGTVVTTGKAIAAALGTLDVTGTNAFGAGKTISAWSETDGKISITSQNISITSSQVSDKTDTYNATGTALVTGKAIANAINSLNLSTTYEAHGAASAVEQRLMEIIGTAGTPASIKSGVTLYRNTGSTYVTVTASELVDGVTYYKDNTGTTQAIAGTDYTLKVAGTGLIGRIEELENK